MPAILPCIGNDSPTTRFSLACVAFVCLFRWFIVFGWFQDYAYNATFPEFRLKAESCGKQVLQLIQVFLNHVRQEGELGLPEVGDAGDPEFFQVRTGIFCSFFFFRFFVFTV